MAADQIVSWLIDLLQLPRKNLIETDRRDELRIVVEGFVDLGENALRLHGHVIEIGAPQHRALALGDFGTPRIARGNLSGPLPLAGFGDERFERGAGIGDDAEFRRKNASDLRRIDVDMHERAAPRVDVGAAGMPVRPAVPDSEHEVALEKGGIAVAVLRLESDQAGIKRMVVGNGAPAHQGRHDGRVRQLRERHEVLVRFRIDDAAAGDDERAFRRKQQIDGAADRLATRPRPHDLERLVDLGIVVDDLALHVDRKIDMHGPRAPGAHELECAAEDARYERPLHHRHRPLRHGRRDRGDVDRLEIFLVELGARRLPRDAQDWDAVGQGRVKPRYHIGAGGPRRAEVDADPSGPGAAVTLGRVRASLFVPYQNVPNLPARAQGVIERQDGGARHSENELHAFALQHVYGGFHRCHFGHASSPTASIFVYCIPYTVGLI